LYGFFYAYVLWAVCVVAAVKIMSLIVSFIKFHRPLFLHTILNKITGFAVFVLPFFYKTGCFTVMIYIACVIAFIAAAEELLCVLRLKDCNRDIKGILF
ncbi:MAG: CDP-alcohol phosphatidyltransferase family protein, partial [Acutalibacteraceae bacterium]